MRKRIDITGQRFGRWTVIRRAESPLKKKGTFWECKCDCGVVRPVLMDNLKASLSRSCGCPSADVAVDRCTKHGRCGTKIYRTWRGMMSRCYNSNFLSYAKYGARGIKVCERWHKFENFFDDLWPIPDGCSLDRIDNNGDYSPENCRWATAVQQANNKRTSRLIEYQGEKLTARYLSEKIGIKYDILRWRIANGWSDERAVNTPAKGYIPTPQPL